MCGGVYISVCVGVYVYVYVCLMSVFLIKKLKFELLHRVARTETTKSR